MLLVLAACCAVAVLWLWHLPTPFNPQGGIVLQRKDGAIGVPAASANPALKQPQPLLATAQQQVPDPPSCTGPLAGGAAHIELEGMVIVAGWAPDGSGLTASSARECCQACEAVRGCNTWVHCPSGGCAGQCWLKHQEDPRNPGQRGKGRSNPWTSGSLLRAFLDAKLPLPPPDPLIGLVILMTDEGDIRLKLRPDWSASSVDYMRRLSKLGDDSCVKCELYRVEPGFLLQGVLRSVMPANKVTTLGPKIMEMGEVGWAGGGPGPDFFIYLGDQPAAHFGHDHTVWAEVADPTSLETAKHIVQLPSHTPGGPGTMRFLQKPLDISVKGVRDG